MKTLCPKCKSGNVEVSEYMGVKCIICNDCGYDESQQYEVYPEEKGSQKEKSRHSPYKAGGFGRAKK